MDIVEAARRILAEREAELRRNLKPATKINVYDFMPKILTDEEEKKWLDPLITTQSTIAPILSVYPEDKIIAWPVRKKFNLSDPFDESIIEKVNADQTLSFSN